MQRGYGILAASGALLLVDAATSVGAVVAAVDEWGIEAGALKIRTTGR